jgi:hypothetical protein
LLIADLDWRLAIGDWRLQIDDWRTRPRAITNRTVDNPIVNQQSTIDNPLVNQQSKSAIANRQSVNLQSAIRNLQ